MSIDGMVITLFPFIIAFTIAFAMIAFVLVVEGSAAIFNYLQTIDSMREMKRLKGALTVSIVLLSLITILRCFIGLYENLEEIGLFLYQNLFMIVNFILVCVVIALIWLGVEIAAQTKDLPKAKNDNEANTDNVQYQLTDDGELEAIGKGK